MCRKNLIDYLHVSPCSDTGWQRGSQLFGQDRMFHSLSGASRYSDYAAVSRVRPDRELVEQAGVERPVRSVGFRTLTIQKRSSEVWNLLAAVQTHQLESLHSSKTT